jgi:hypothetical protein
MAVPTLGGSTKATTGLRFCATQKTFASAGSRWRWASWTTPAKPSEKQNAWFRLLSIRSSVAFVGKLPDSRPSGHGARRLH